MMLEIRRGKAVRHYENSFFREFAKNLKNMFDKYNLDGLLIANSECTVDERLQIDTLLVADHVVCIIDFKNFGGKIILPTEDDFYNGIWTNENGKRVKGGSSINPYKQLSIQKKKFLNNERKNIIGIYEKFIKDNIAKEDKFNPKHILKMVCFQKEITLEGEIPAKNQIDFFIADKSNYLEQIKDILDITSRETKISVDSYKAFKEVFKANKFDLEEVYEEKKVKQKIVKNEHISLYQDQISALEEIEDFLVSDKNVFILKGSTNSGKSHIIQSIEELAFSKKYQEVKTLVQSKRIANNLSNENINFNSIYSYIYGGADEEKNREEIKIIPLKQNNDEEECLYIIDEAQLITDSFYRSIDLQFGSGHLLKDLLEFINCQDSKRKIIFIGDPYQLIIGSKEQISINNDYLENTYQLGTKTSYLVDKPTYSYNTKEALRCINGIQSQQYNLLQFNLSNTISTIQKEKLKEYITLNMNNSFKILVYSNIDAQKINLWIKKTILKNGEDINKEDLILFNNNIKIQNPNDPFAQTQSIFNGEFAKVIEVSNSIISESISLKNKVIILKFRKLKVQLFMGEIVEILSLENFRLNLKNELSNNETIAYQVLLNQLIEDEIKNNPFENSDIYKQLIYSDNYKQLSDQINSLSIKLDNGEKVKTKKDKVEKELRKLERHAKKEYKKFIVYNLNMNISSKYYKYKNSAWIKFGWAMTVHKAISYKFDEVLINTDQGDNRGKSNENYFRWIYSALTRATKNIKLINYKPITPLSKIVVNVIKREHKEFFFIGDLEEFNSFVKAKISNNDIVISSVNHHSYQEQYIFSDTNKNSATLVFYYNGKFQFKEPKLVSFSNEEFGQKIMSIFKEEKKLENFDFIRNDFKEIYIDLNTKLNKHNIYFSYIIQKKYIDEIKFISNNKTIIAEFNYNGDGFFTKINIFDNNNSNLALNLKNILENI